MCLSTYIYTITAETLKKEYNDDDDDDDDDSFPYISFSYTTTLRFPCVISVVSCFVLFFLLLLLAMIKSTRNNVVPPPLLFFHLFIRPLLLDGKWNIRQVRIYTGTCTRMESLKNNMYMCILFSPTAYHPVSINISLCLQYSGDDNCLSFSSRLRRGFPRCIYFHIGIIYI